jgi:WD40 repeat protein
MLTFILFKVGFFDDKCLLALIHDAERFVALFGDTIGLSSAHVYISALPFAPKASEIYKRYHNAENKHSIDILEGGITSWPPVNVFPPRLMAGSDTKGTQCVAFSPDCKRLASGSKDGKICLWYVSSGRPVGPPFGCHSHWVTSVSFSPNGRNIISGSLDHTVCLWDAETSELIGQPLEASKDYGDGVISVAFTTDGKYIVAESFSGRTTAWKVATSERVAPHLISKLSCESPPFIVERTWLCSVPDLRLLCRIPRWVPDDTAWAHRDGRIVIWDGCSWVIIDISRVLASTFSHVQKPSDLTTYSVGCVAEGTQTKVCLECLMKHLMCLAVIFLTASNCLAR